MNAPLRLRRIIVESPFSAPTAEGVLANVTYLRRCLRDCIERQESPYASHGLIAALGVLDDRAPVERALGIAAGLAWGEVADATIVFTDYGISPGMRHGIAAAERDGRPVEYRRLGEGP